MLGTFTIDVDVHGLLQSMLPWLFVRRYFVTLESVSILKIY